MKNKLKAVFFDFDDTLFDHRHCSRTALDWLRNNYNCFNGTTLDELELEHLKILEEIHFRKVLTGEFSIDDARAERFRRIFKNHGMESPENSMLEAARNYRKVYESSYKLVDGAKDLLDSIKGKTKIVVITNNLIKEQEGKIRKCNVENYIDELVTSEEVGFTKPEPEIFHAALKRVNCTPDEVIMVGDSWERDVLGAVNVGIKNIWINIFNDPFPDKDLAVEFKSTAELNKSCMLYDLMSD